MICVRKNRNAISQAVSQRKIFDNSVLVVMLMCVFFTMAFAQPVEKDAEVNSGEENDSMNALRMGTFNLWHGLDPVGLWKFREYESEVVREKRLELFITGAREMDVDIWFLQEANMLPGLADRLAKELEMYEVHQVDNCGIKAGLGLPVNFKSGLVILAKKDFQLKKLGGVKLSGPFGFCGDVFGFQLKEFRYALVAEINVEGRRMVLVNLHLHHGPEADGEFRKALTTIKKNGEISAATENEIFTTVQTTHKRRRGELETLFAFLESHGLDGLPIIMAGDFNASPDSDVMKWMTEEMAFVNTTGPWNPEEGYYTWDFENNPNTNKSLDFTPAFQFENEQVMSALKTASTKTRRLDYILYRDPEKKLKIKTWDGIFQRQVDGVFASDHFGIRADVSLE